MLALLKKPLLAPLWLVLRIVVGWQWLIAGIDKVSHSASWYGVHAGASVAGMVNGAAKMTTGAHPSVLAIPAGIAHAIIIPTAGFWGFLIPWAEVLTGLGLMVGGLTGTALLGAMVMNLVYMLMGSDGVNPVLFTMEAILVTVGPAVALWGLDNWLFHNWQHRHLLFHPNHAGDHGGPQAA